VLPAKIAVAVGLALLLSGYALGLHEPSASLDGRAVSCNSVVDVNWFPFSGTESGTTAQRPDRPRVQAACHSAALPFEVGTWGALGVGAVLVLVGWTVLREAPAPVEPSAPRSRTPRSTPSA
jgi:hypothetical protein